jgi:hypothetical protein
MLADKPVDAAAADSNRNTSNADDGSVVSSPPSADLSSESAINPTPLSSSPSSSSLSPSSSSALVVATDAAISESIEMLERVCAATAARVTAIDGVSANDHRSDPAGLGAALHDSSAMGAADVMQRSRFAAKLFADIARDRFEARLQLLNRKFEVWVEVCIFVRLGIILYALSKSSSLVFAFTRCIISHTRLSYFSGVL